MPSAHDASRHALDALPTETVPHCLLHPATAGAADPVAAGFLGLPAVYGVLACPRCGLRWLSPRPTAAGYETIYSYDVYFEGDGAVESYRAVAERRRWAFRRRLRQIERLAGQGRPLRLLDVGAATGEFVAAARARGHAADGYEPSAGARDEARRLHGVDLHAGDLAGLAGPYDAIHLNHVVEHLPDPLATLAALARRIAPDGVLAVEVPQQFDNVVERLKGLLGRGRHGCFDAYSLHHTYFFTPPTLAATLAAAGFAVVEQRTAHWGLTPPLPFSPRELALGALLWLSDKLRRAGPVIEVYARPAGDR